MGDPRAVLHTLLLCFLPGYSSGSLAQGSGQATAEQY
jgi:hypothetical protein